MQMPETTKEFPDQDLSSASAFARIAHPSGFDFTWHMRRLCADMIRQLPELAHIDLKRVAVSYSQTRKAVQHGLQAALTPMRFERGERFTIRDGGRWTVSPLHDAAGREMLYILSFYLPRFLEQPVVEKLVTVLHELWHISPEFNGDLRRHPGRCYVHTQSEREYDLWVKQLAYRWLALRPDKEVYEFLRYDFQQLRGRYGSVYGVKIPVPKLIRLPDGLGSHR